MTETTEQSGELPSKTEAETTQAGPKFSYEQLEQYHDRAIGDNVKLRKEKAELKSRITELDTQARKVAEHEETISKMNSAHRAEITAVRLESLAIREGILDSDATKLIDLNEVKYGDDGKPVNLKEIIEAFKVAKPHFFAQKSTSTASTSTVPKPKPDAEVNAYDMSDEEFAKWRQSPSRYNR